MASVDKVSIDSDERGFEMWLELDEEVCTFASSGVLRLNIQGVAEELYDAVKSTIGPWLQERDAAYAEYRAGARGLTDAEREEEERCAALGMEGPNHKLWMQERHG